MDRKTRLAHLKRHPWYGKIFEKIGPTGLAIVEKFVEEHHADEEEVYGKAMQNFFINKKKPANWSTIWDVMQSLR